MARSGSSSKFVPVNLNSSYGQPHQSSSSSNGSSAGLGRSRSFGSSYGGMVSLNRPSRTPSSSFVTAPASSRASKLTVPRPVNLPSLRREHSGNDPNVTLVVSSGSSGWTKQIVEDGIGATAISDKPKPEDSSWGNSSGKSTHGIDGSNRGAPSTSTPRHGLPLEKAVVFRGEDFPTLQAAAVPHSTSTLSLLCTRGLQQNQQNEVLNEQQSTPDILQQHNAGDGFLYSRGSYECHLQSSDPIRMLGRGNLSDQADSSIGERSGGYARGPSPIRRLAHNSNWVDDERETLSSVQMQDRMRSNWSEPNDGFHAAGSWLNGRRADSDIRRPSSKCGRNDGELGSPFSAGYIKEKGAYIGGRFEHEQRSQFDKSISGVGRNDFLKRGWSFSAADYNTRLRSPSDAMERERDASGRVPNREVREFRHETSGRDMFPRDVRPGLNFNGVAQGQDSKFGRDDIIGKQGFPGSGLVSPSSHNGRGNDFLYCGSDAFLSGKSNIMSQDFVRVDPKRERKAISLFGQAHNDDPFLGDGMSPSLYRSSPLDNRNSRMKKETLKDDIRDPARESFEAELERVEKLMEQERQRVAEEREHAIEIARKEREEQERFTREEEERRRKLEEEAREAAYRAKREAEEAARKVEEARKAKDEERRIAGLEEERRKEAARRKLLELEERIARRESIKRQEDETHDTRRMRQEDETHDTRRRNNEVSMDLNWKSQPSSAKSDKESGPGSARLPSDSAVTFGSPQSSKGQKGFLTGARLPTWKREVLDQVPERRSAEVGKMPDLQDNQEWGTSSFRNSSFRVHKDAVLVGRQEMASFEDMEERSWWGRDAPSQSHNATYPDSLEYPSIGRLRQSLPKQPKVLPPPPGQAVLRKHRTPSDEHNHEFSSSFNGHFEEEAPFIENPVRTENPGRTEVVEPHDPENEDGLPTVMQVSQQLGSSPSEEVVLSDAGSQFSDDSLEDEVPPTMETVQEQELHSDIVSEAYTEEEEEEVDEMVDSTEAEERLEDHLLNRQALEGEERFEKVGNSLKKEKDDGFGVQHEMGGRGPEVNHDVELIHEGKVFEEGREGSKRSESGSLIEDVAMAAGENPTKEPAPAESMVSKDGEPAIELSSEKGTREQVTHHYVHPTPFLPASMVDAGQVIQLEGASTRPMLMHQFQQPFSFMAVPIPESGMLNHVVTGPAMVPSVHGLPNQDLPFHLQLGLLPGVPLLPNAIQIGSIQMPLDVHPQMPQIAHLHGPQVPVLQFGQISHSVLDPLPAPSTQSAPQLHHLLLQSSSSQHQHVTPLNLNTLFNGGDATSVRDVAASANQDCQVSIYEPKTVRDVAASANQDCQVSIYEPKTEVAAVPVAILGVSTDEAGHKHSLEDKLEASGAGFGSRTNHNTGPSSRPSRGQRRSNVPRYHGILGRGRGRGRFPGVQNYPHQAPRIVAENWVQTGARGSGRDRIFRKSYLRTEYRVREPLPLNVTTDETAPGPNREEYKGYRYIKKGGGSQHKALGDDIGQAPSTSLHPVENVREGKRRGDQSQSTSGKEEQPISGKEYPPTKQVSATLPSSSKARGFLRKYEVDTGEDTMFRTGVVRVFEQPGIESPNDKDDFIKVRSKRHLLRELREQRGKESKTKAQDIGVSEQVSKKQPKPFAKAGRTGGTSGAGSNKTSVRKWPVGTSETNGQRGTTSGSEGAMGLLNARNRTTKNAPKSGRATLSSKDAMMETGCVGHDNRVSEHSTTAAWGGQRTNQEVVSLTQIQLEEAMKPSRLDDPFPESRHVPEKAMATVEEGSSSSSSTAPVEKTAALVKAASSPLSSLLAGEKIQFGAVTSPTVLPSSNHQPSPMAVVRTGSPLGFRGDSPLVTSDSINYVGGYSEAHMAATFTSSKGMDSTSRHDDGFHGKVVDLEAEAEAAASAVAVAAISSEDFIESHLSARGSVNAAKGQTVSSRLPETSNLSLQPQNISELDNPIGTALPGDLLAERPPSLFQGSSMTLSTSGFVLQSLPSGAPTYSGLEMGPLLGGPAVFSFGPHEDTLASMEPRVPNWQQRHIGNPDSFYGAPPPPPPYLSPAGLPSIQGHPHMLVYANPFTPGGPFGQLGVSFMGAAYHPSDKQPDWMHVPPPSSSLGPLAPTEGHVSGGVLTTQHLSGASSSFSTQRMQVLGSSITSLAAPANPFDMGLDAPFQSRWSKAPAPPVAVHSSPCSESASPIQIMPVTRPAVEQMHASRVVSLKPGHLPHALGVSSSFQQLPPIASGPFSSVVTGPQLPDVRGLLEAGPAGSGLVGGRSLSEASLLNSGEELISRLQSLNQDGTRGQASVDSHKAVGRTPPPTFHTGSSPYVEQRAPKRALSNGAEWSKSSQREAGSGRASPLADSGGGSIGPAKLDSRGGSVAPLKLKQVYVAKPAADPRKLAAACT